MLLLCAILPLYLFIETHRKTMLANFLAFKTFYLAFDLPALQGYILPISSFFFPWCSSHCIALHIVAAQYFLKHLHEYYALS